MKAVALFIIALGEAASAGPSAYYCKIEGFHAPQISNEVGKDWIGRQAMEHSIAVDRNTGRILHPFIGNASMRVVFVQPGTPDWSFKSLAESYRGGAADGGSHIVYMEVHEYRTGPVKPFVMISDGVSYWGNCN